MKNCCEQTETLTLTRVLDVLDQVRNYYAHTVGITTGVAAVERCKEELQKAFDKNEVKP